MTETATPQTESSMEEPEIAKRKTLLEGVAKMYSVDINSQAVRYFVDNVSTLQVAARKTGYEYGLGVHRMPQGMKDSLVSLGKQFLEGSLYAEDEMKYRDVGLDIFKSLTVKIDSENYELWVQFVAKRS